LKQSRKNCAPTLLSVQIAKMIIKQTLTSVLSSDISLTGNSTQRNIKSFVKTEDSQFIYLWIVFKHDIIFIQELSWSFLYACYNWCLLNAAWIWAKGNDDMTGCTAGSSVSASCRRCSILTLSSYTMTRFTLCIPDTFLMNYQYISIDTILYSLCFTNWTNPLSSLKSLPKLQPEPSLRS